MERRRALDTFQEWPADELSSIKQAFPNPRLQANLTPRFSANLTLPDYVRVARHLGGTLDCSLQVLDDRLGDYALVEVGTQVPLASAVHAYLTSREAAGTYERLPPMTF